MANLSYRDRIKEQKFDKRLEESFAELPESQDDADLDDDYPTINLDDID